LFDNHAANAADDGDHVDDGDEVIRDDCLDASMTYFQRIFSYEFDL